VPINAPHRRGVKGYRNISDSEYEAGGLILLYRSSAFAITNAGVTVGYAVNHYGV